jgi:hypothetical protein
LESDEDVERWRKLLESPFDDTGPRKRSWPWVAAAAGAIAAVLIVVGLSLTAGGDEVSPTTAAAAPPQTTVIEEPRHPEPRLFYEVARDPETGRIIFFGGGALGAQGQGEFVEGTWAYDPSTGEWFEFPDVAQPPNRAGHALAHGGASGLIVMFGGGEPPRTCGVSGPCALFPLGDTWVLDPASGEWQQKFPATAPSARYGAAMAYDTESEMLVLFGGAVRTGSAFVNEPFGDTWTYDVAADSWTELAPAESPPARAWHRMTYDPGSDRILLFGGGAPGGVDGLVWAYDANENTWGPFAATGPSPRWGGVVTFDEQSRKLVVVGGRGPVERSLGDAGTATEILFLDDVWVFDPQADMWEGRDLLDHALYWVSAAWDPATDRTVTFFETIGTYDVESSSWEWQEPLDDLG